MRGGLALVFGVACSGSTVDQGVPDDIGLDVVHSASGADAAAGNAWLWGQTTGRWGFPLLGFQALGVLRGGAIVDEEGLFDLLRDDYGFLENADDPAGPPAGVIVQRDLLQFTCLSCHVDRVAGELVVGGSNGSVDWELLATDLGILANGAGVAVPLTLDDFTGAPGTHDAWGLGFRLASEKVPADVNVDFGFQQSPAWWSRRYKQRLYLDGSGSTEGRRTMAAMYLGYGANLEQIMAMEDDLDDAWAAMIQLPSPEWSLSELDPVKWREGEAVFAAHCAECHGHYSGSEDRGFPDRVEDVGTDPLRHSQMRQQEVDFINASWFGQDGPFEATDGYLAPVLHGVWSTAPYFHNGAVPTLWGVLDSSSRPPIWARAGHELEDYDVERVGLVVTEYPTADDAPVAIFDAATPGLGNQGHLLGDVLSDDERWSVIEYLKSL